MKPEKCATCNRDPKRMNGHFSECSHVDCQHRRRAWSERPTGHEYMLHEPKKPEDGDPLPLDQDPQIKSVLKG